MCVNFGVVVGMTAGTASVRLSGVGVSESRSSVASCKRGVLRISYVGRAL